MSSAMSNTRLQLFAVSAVFFIAVEHTAVLFSFLPEQMAFLASLVIKCFPMKQLIEMVRQRGSREVPYTTGVLLGLRLSLIGDGLLVYAAKYEVAFLLGLAAFLVAHLFYIAAMGYDQFRPEIFFPCLLQGVPVFLYLFRHKLGDDALVMQISCVVYGLALYVMMWRAWARVKQFDLAGGDKATLAAIGATLFTISDIILAVEKFCFHIPATRVFNMSTYFAGQMFIALSVGR